MAQSSSLHPSPGWGFPSFRFFLQEWLVLSQSPPCFLGLYLNISHHCCLAPSFLTFCQSLSKRLLLSFPEAEAAGCPQGWPRRLTIAAPC